MAKNKVDQILALMKKQDQIRNICTIAHIDHGKTTFSDNLLAGAGMISEELAGQQLFLDFDDQEQARGITINSACVSMVHSLKGQDYLINLIDTPGHVDFGGDVTRALRAVDGAIVLACAVEGVMPQTETVLRQAMKDRCKPVLFINKVDRLVNELKLPPEKIQERIVKIVKDVNKLIRAFAPKEKKDEWTVNVADGSVSFGSAYHNWGLSIPYMQAYGRKFSDITDLYKQDKKEELIKLAPLSDVVLNMVVRHLPNPVDAQQFRIPRLWPGELDSPDGKHLLSCDPKGPAIAVIVRITNDPHAGDVSTGRVFSGVLKKGMTVKLLGVDKTERIQQVGVYKGPQRFPVDEVPAGNIVAIVGLRSSISGETITDKEDTEPFEAIKHIFEPVVTKAIEAKQMRDLPKLIEVLRRISREDPTLKVEINPETGEHLLSGLGELHLDIWEYRIKNEQNIPIETSPPIVVYHEGVGKQSPQVEGKSPNKHNKFYMTVEPMPEGVLKAIDDGFVSERRVKSKDNELTQVLVDAGMDRDEAKKIRDIYNRSMFIDLTRGVVALHEIIELIVDGFHEALDTPPLANEKAINVLVKLYDCKLHEDAIHRGPGQIIPAVRGGIKGAFLHADPFLLEPRQIIRIDTPEDYMGEVSKLIQGRRGQILDMEHEGHMMIIRAKMPVSDMFGFTADVRSGTTGRGHWSLIDSHFERLPRELQKKTILEIRKRKGMKAEIPGGVY